MKIDNLWKRIDSLVTGPSCRTRDNKIIEWSDERTMPTEDELLAVDLEEVDIKKEKEKKDLSDSIKNKIDTSIDAMSIDQSDKNILSSLFNDIATMKNIKG